MCAIEFIMASDWWWRVYGAICIICRRINFAVGTSDFKTSALGEGKKACSHQATSNRPLQERQASEQIVHVAHVPVQARKARLPAMVGRRHAESNPLLQKVASQQAYRRSPLLIEVQGHKKVYQSKIILTTDCDCMET